MSSAKISVALATFCLSVCFSGPPSKAQSCGDFLGIAPQLQTGCTLRVTVQLDPFNSCGAPLPGHLEIRVYRNAPSDAGGVTFLSRSTPCDWYDTRRNWRPSFDLWPDATVVYVEAWRKPASSSPVHRCTNWAPIRVDKPANCGDFSGYGNGTAGAGGFTPLLTGAGAPVVNSSLELFVREGLGGSVGFLLFGANRAALPGLGGTLLVQPPWKLLPVSLMGTIDVPAAGWADLNLVIPDDQTLVGIVFDIQLLLSDQATLAGFSMSAGLEVEIGG